VIFASKPCFYGYKLIIIIGGWYVQRVLKSVLNIVDRLKLVRQYFENWVCFRFQVKVGGREMGVREERGEGRKDCYLVGPLETARIYSGLLVHQYQCFSKTFECIRRRSRLRMIEIYV